MHEAARQLVLSWLIRHKEIRGPECKLKTSRQYADDGVAISVERDRAADDARVATKSSLPQAVSQDRDSWTTLSIFAALESPAEKCIDAEH